MTACFVTGAGTDVGKTFVACGLLHTLRRRGRAVTALKPVASGFDAARAAVSDPGRLLAASARPATAEAIARIAPWRFSAALSPDMAAQREGRSIDFDRLLAFCRSALAETGGELLIEGIGGVFVPLDERHTVLDWIAALDLPVILVGGSYLGALNHNLSALALLQARRLTVLALVVSETAESPVPLAETAATLGRFAAGVPVLALPRLADPASHHPVFGHLAALLTAG